MEIIQFDIKTGILNVEFADIFMEQSHGLRKLEEQLICKLTNDLYGSKQSFKLFLLCPTYGKRSLTATKFVDYG